MDDFQLTISPGQAVFDRLTLPTMRSTRVSRNVCRRLLVSHDLSSPASALSGLSHAGPLRPTRPRRALVQLSSHRTFLNFLRAKPPREIKNVGFEPGFDLFIQFRANTLNGVKPPSDEDLLQAVRVFFDNKLSFKKPVNPTQALVVRDVIEHLQSHKPESNGEAESQAGARRKIWLAQSLLTRDDLQKALRALARQHRQGPSEEVAKLAMVVYTELQALMVLLNGRKGTRDRWAEFHSDDLLRLITILTHHSQAGQAAEVVSKFQDFQNHTPDPRDPKPKKNENKLLELQLIILRGYARKMDHHRLRSHAQMMCDAGFPYTPEFQTVMTNAFITMGESGEGELREWFEKPVADAKLSQSLVINRLPSPKSYLDLVNFSFKTGREPEWIKTALQELCDMNPPKRWWDVIFRWAIYQGKDIGHVRKMVDVVAQVNLEDESVHVDIHTINGMLEAAIARTELLLAERINSLASELGLRRNDETHILLLQARIAGQDKVGAASTFEDILHTGFISPGSKISDALNSYVRFLASISDSASVIEAVSRVEARNGELEPETVVDVCMKFLRDDKTMEVIDTLGLHLSQFSMEERKVVRTELVQYCLDRDISTARAWDAYSLLRQYWPETSRGERTKLMRAFFSRKRPDMACHVFGHMRAHPDDSLRPDIDTYVICLEDLGAYPDSDSLAMIHNMFKMDALIQPSTRLYNAFMIAYTGCNQSRKAFEFWRQVANSKDGPTYKSLELVFRVCQSLPGGYDRAKGIWDKMHNLEVDVPAFVYDAFTLMAAGQAALEKVKGLLVARLAEHGEEPSQIFLTRIHNALPFPELQEAYQEWAALEFPDKWQKVQKLRKTKTLQGTDRILIPPERVTAD
ncbi:unnamed protein product [Discula destructiva]